MEILTLVLIAAGAVLVLWYVRMRAEDRREAIFAFAAARSMHFAREDPFGLTDLPFRLFTLGDGRGCENVIWGELDQVPVRLADYWYYTESSDSKGHTTRHYRRFSVSIAELPWLVPHVSVAPEGMLSRFADHMGFRDLEFESARFNRQFQVEADDRQFAYRLLDPRMIEWLEPLEGFGFETLGGFLLVWCERLDPKDIAALLGAVKGFRGRVPRLVWNEYGTGSRVGREERSEA